MLAVEESLQNLTEEINEYEAGNMFNANECDLLYKLAHYCTIAQQ